MNYPWIDAYCLAKPGTAKEFKEEWQALRFLIGGKMYALMGSDNTGKPILTLKLEPLLGEHLRSLYSDITPGYYMNKLHWNSVALEGSVPDDVVKDMLDKSYSLVLASLTQKQKAGIQNESR